MTTIVTRAGKGSPLTNVEVDANFTNLNNDKLEKSGGTITANSTDPALKITQTGEGNALVVEDAASPDTTPFVIDNSGFVIAGNTSRTSVQGTPQVQVFGTYSYLSGRYSNNSGSSEFEFAKSRSATVGAYSSVASGDALGSMTFSGDDGAAFQRGAAIYGYVDGTPGTGSMPGRLVFSTTPSGSAAPAERMRIDSAGQVSITTNNTTNALKITQTGTGNALVVEDTSGDTTPFVIDAGGRVISGNTVAISDSVSSPRVQLHAVTNLADSRYGAFNWEANINGASIVFAKSRSTIPGTYAIASSGDFIGTINFEADDGVQFRRAAQITASVDGTPGTGDMPGRLVFSTTGDGGSSPVERMRIDSAGNTTLNTRLRFNGLTGSAPSGAQAEIIHNTGGSVDYGLYLRHHNGTVYDAEVLVGGDASNNGSTVRVNTGGAERMRIGASGSTTITATATEPLKLIGAGGLFVGSAFQISDASATASRNWYSDYRNENGIPVANNVVAMNTDGSSALFWTTTPAGSRTADRRANALKIDSSGNVLALNPNGGLGYGTGAGGAVTQATSKGTGVTLNKPTGQITLHNEALAAGASALITVNNSIMGATDLVIAHLASTGVVDSAAYRIDVVRAGAGSFRLRITNVSAASLSEAAIINFAIIKGATA